MWNLSVTRSSFKNFSFTKSRSGVVQMSVNSILSLKDIRVLFESLLVIRMSMHLVWASKVSNLSDAKLPVADLHIKKPWLCIERILVILPRYNIVSYRWPIVKSFWLRWDAYGWPLRAQLGPLWPWWGLGSLRVGRRLGPLWSRLWRSHRLDNLLINSIFQVGCILQGHSLIVEHPWLSALVVFSVPRRSHHHIVNFLLWVRRRWRVVTNIVSLVPGVLLNGDILSIEFSVLLQFASFESVSLSPCWHPLLHPREVFFQIRLDGLIPFHIDILDGIMSRELAERPEGVDARVGHHSWPESLGPRLDNGFIQSSSSLHNAHLYEFNFIKVKNIFNLFS